MKPTSTDLTLEQQFSLAQARALLEKANLAQLKQLYLELYEYHLKQKNHYQSLIATSWGINESNQPTAEEERGSEGTDDKAT